jgi:hypothetical protein
MRVDLRLAGIAELQREMAKLATPWRPGFGRRHGRRSCGRCQG